MYTMKQLSETWFAEGRIDFELKKYTLLAYLQDVNAEFNENKLYPQLADMIFHYNNISSFKTNKKYLQEQFPKRLNGIQLENLQVLYQQIIEDDEVMQELEEIIHFASGKMKTAIQSGTELYEFVQEKLDINPIGLIPLNVQEGYFFLSTSESKTTTRVYQYRLSIFEKHNENYRTIKTTFIDNWNKSISSTYENIKGQLLKYRTMLPNPAVYSIETQYHFPIDETLLPVAKRCLVKFLSDNG